MTDHELLELAARAAGIKYTIKDGLFVAHGNKNEPPIPWNPLDDDGDALRLAMKLRLRIEFPSDKPYGPERVSINGMSVIEDIADDIYAATRRAIVRAAAEIGRAMG